MILVDRTILAAQENKNGGLQITPFNRENLQGNAYDVHLGETLMIIDPLIIDGDCIDCKRPIHTVSYKIKDEGELLRPGILYLGVTTERITLRDYCAELMGKSSLGRLGVSPHYTAGLIDAGFDGYITLEITVVHPTRVYAGQPIGQLVFKTLTDKPIRPYNIQPDAKYNQQVECVPVAGQFFKNWDKETKTWK